MYHGSAASQFTFRGILSVCVCVCSLSESEHMEFVPMTWQKIKNKYVYFLAWLCLRY